MNFTLSPAITHPHYKSVRVIVAQVQGGYIVEFHQLYESLESPSLLQKEMLLSKERAAPVVLYFIETTETMLAIVQLFITLILFTCIKVVRMDMVNYV